MTTNDKSTLSRPLLVVAALVLLAGAIAAGWRWADGGGEPSTAARPADAPRPKATATLPPLPPPAGIARTDTAPPVDPTRFPQDDAGRKPMPPPLLTPPGPPPPVAASGQQQLPSPEELAAIPPPPEIAAGLANPPPDILRGMQNPPPEMVKGLKTPPPWVKQMPLK
jgi:hypothetical protein